MFIELIMNYETNKRKIVRVSDIAYIAYNGDKSIHVKLKPESAMKTKSFGLHYPSKQIAMDLYTNLTQSLGVMSNF